MPKEVSLFVFPNSTIVTLEWRFSFELLLEYEIRICLFVWMLGCTISSLHRSALSSLSASCRREFTAIRLAIIHWVQQCWIKGFNFPTATQSLLPQRVWVGWVVTLYTSHLMQCSWDMCNEPHLATFQLTASHEVWKKKKKKHMCTCVSSSFLDALASLDFTPVSD